MEVGHLSDASTRPGGTTLWTKDLTSRLSTRTTWPWGDDGVYIVGIFVGTVDFDPLVVTQEVNFCLWRIRWIPG